MGTQAFVFLVALNAACDGTDQLAEAICTCFQQHPDCAVITSFPGPAEVAGACIHAEVGDDRSASPTSGHSIQRRLSPHHPRFRGSHAVTTAGSKTTASPQSATPGRSYLDSRIGTGLGGRALVSSFESVALSNLGATRYQQRLAARAVEGPPSTSSSVAPWGRGSLGWS